MTDTVPLSRTADRDRRHVLHPFTALADHERQGPPTVIVGGQGAVLTDEGGRDYVDAMAGLWCVNIGYGRADSGKFRP